MLNTTTAVDWHQQLVEQLRWHWDGQLRPRLDGITDEEYHWAPVSDSWDIRPRSESSHAVQLGSGDWTCDFVAPEPDPAPVTTIGWRIAHLVVGVFGARAAAHFDATFEWGAPDYEHWSYAGNAAEGMRQLDATYRAWMDGIAGLTLGDLSRQVGNAEGQWADHSMAQLVLHINREAIHHGAEIALLRDLYLRRRGGTDQSAALDEIDQIAGQVGGSSSGPWTRDEIHER